MLPSRRQLAEAAEAQEQYADLMTQATLYSSHSAGCDVHYLTSQGSMESARHSALGVLNEAAQDALQIAFLHTAQHFEVNLLPSVFSCSPTLSTDLMR